MTKQWTNLICPSIWYGILIHFLNLWLSGNLKLPEYNSWNVAHLGHICCVYFYTANIPPPPLPPPHHHPGISLGKLIN